MSVAFTDVGVPKSGTGTARSYTKSEYAQSLGDPKGTLFDTNIECRRHTGVGSGGVVTSLPGPTTLCVCGQRLKANVCVLYDSLCAPLLLPWLGEVEGTSLAMYQAKASPVPAHVPMFRVPTVLRRVPSAVPPTVVGAC